MIQVPTLAHGLVMILLPVRLVAAWLLNACGLPLGIHWSDPLYCNCIICFSVCCSDPGSWTETELRRLETAKDSFEVWQQKLLQAAAAYPGKENLVGSLARRVKTCLDRGGGATDD